MRVFQNLSISSHCIQRAQKCFHPLCGISVVETATNMPNPLFPMNGGGKCVGEGFFCVVVVSLFVLFFIIPPI